MRWKKCFSWSKVLYKQKFSSKNFRQRVLCISSKMHKKLKQLQKIYFVRSTRWSKSQEQLFKIIIGRRIKRKKMWFAPYGRERSRIFHDESKNAWKMQRIEQKRMFETAIIGKIERCFPSICICHIKEMLPNAVNGMYCRISYSASSDSCAAEWQTSHWTILACL